MRTTIAFLVAPSTTLLLAATSPSDWGFFAFITLFYSYPLALALGLPTYFYFRRMGWLTLLRSLGAGAVIGGLLPMLFALFVLFTAVASIGSTSPVPPNSFIGLLGMLVFGAILGAAVALVFWLIAVAPELRRGPGKETSTASLGE